MRILHVDAGKEMRGGQWQVLRLMEGLAAEGVESVLLARREAPLFDAAGQHGLRVEPLSLWRAAAMARRQDLMHAHDSRSHTLGALIPGIPLVVSRRVAFGEAHLPPALSRWKYRRPARFLAVSELVKSILMQRGVPEKKISVVHDGVPLLETERPPGEAGCEAPRQPHVLTLANAGDSQKGLALAEQAAKLAGVALYTTSHLERDIQDAAIFVYISHSEGLGSGALLAMSAGVPVVASDIGGLREVIRDGENGLLAADQPTAIAAA